MGEFDGIQERKEGKTRMPLGMAILFIGLTICGLCYLYFFSPLTTGWTQGEQYQRSMGKIKADVTSHETKEVETGQAESGKADEGIAIYKADCAMCHGENLEGGIGPALTGPKFVYGSSLSDLARVINEGTPKGMPAFGKQFGPKKVRAAAHYIFFRHAK